MARGRRRTPQREGEPLMKRCSACREPRWIVEFRVLSNGYRAGMDEECERAYDRYRASPHLYPEFARAGR